jgi:hypothetical protein
MAPSPGQRKKGGRSADLRTLRLEPRTVVNCSNTTSIQPLYSTTTLENSTLRHNAFHHRSPCCVRRNRFPTRFATPTLRPHLRLRRTGASQLTRRTACPTSRVSTARTTFPPGRSFTRPTTVSGSGRRWVDNRTRVEEQRGEEKTERYGAHECCSNCKKERYADVRTTGPERQVHAVPLLRHPDRDLLLYVEPLRTRIPLYWH